MADGAAEASLDSDGESQLPRQPGGLCISAPRPRRAPRLLSGEKKQRLGIQKRSPERIIPSLRELADRCSRLASDAHWPAMHRWTGRLSSLPNFMHRCQRYRRLERPRFPPARSAKLANGTHPSDHPPHLNARLASLFAARIAPPRNVPINHFAFSSSQLTIGRCERDGLSCLPTIDTRIYPIRKTKQTRHQ
jgi:hypothetical protein